MCKAIYVSGTGKRKADPIIISGRPPEGANGKMFAIGPR
jgi:hypothetical protein